MKHHQAFKNVLTALLAVGWLLGHSCCESYHMFRFSLLGCSRSLLCASRCRSALHWLSVSYLVFSAVGRHWTGVMGGGSHVG